MQNGIVSGALFLVTFLSPTPIPTHTLNSQISQTAEIRNYNVSEGDTLRSIAKSEYGSEDFWTTIWNDNSWIENPNNIEKGWTIKLSQNKPVLKEELNDDLSKKLDQQKQNAIITAQTVIATIPQPTNITPSSSPQSLNDAQLTFLGNCEGGMNPTRNSGNGYYGAFQFSLGTWNRMNTGYERADLAPIEIQKDAVQRLLTQSSIWGQFPGCARAMQSAGLL